MVGIAIRIRRAIELRLQDRGNLGQEKFAAARDQLQRLRQPRVAIGKGVPEGVVGMRVVGLHLDADALALPHADDVLDAAIAKVGDVMKGDRTKNRVTVYYLLAQHFGKLSAFAK